MTDKQTTDPAPVEDASAYAAWLRARGKRQAEFDRTMGVPKDDERYRLKAMEWHVGYDRVTSRLETHRD
ncbi:hypothetical protein HLH33_18680 [Gluconacetobacter diazotrophicus]|uniref:Uncharacterized protein n=1 Tax=Gluconacetobacter diazotrophicus TaxID=33996 RepID=A0A7W4NIE4_GLUDI|nr:hypothetical protein [Gluconacetobacter diazotrophicus]MBB2158291.1 hypothetical protein [Gluconacetobacter diazotrophicus]